VTEAGLGLLVVRHVDRSLIDGSVIRSFNVIGF
jgi:hypothetical protein